MRRRDVQLYSADEERRSGNCTWIGRLLLPHTQVLAGECGTCSGAIRPRAWRVALEGRNLESYETGECKRLSPQTPFPKPVRAFFNELFAKHEELIWTALVRAAANKKAIQAMSFVYSEFSVGKLGLSIGRPKQVLDLFLWTLTMPDGGTLYSNYTGRLYGIKWRVIGGKNFAVLFYLC